MTHGGAMSCYKTTPEGASIGGGGGSQSGTSTATSSTSTTVDGTALIARTVQITRDLEDNSLISKYDVQPSVLEEIKQRFPMKNPRDVPLPITLYVSFYNLKCKTLIEHTALKDLSIQSDSALTSRITKLDNISNECSKAMDDYEKVLSRDSKRFISKAFKNKP